MEPHASGENIKMRDASDPLKTPKYQEELKNDLEIYRDGLLPVNHGDSNSKLDDVYKDAICDASKSFISKIKPNIAEEFAHLFDDGFECPAVSLSRPPVKTETGNEPEHQHNREGLGEGLGDLRKKASSISTATVDVLTNECYNKLYFIGLKENSGKTLDAISGNIKTLLAESRSKNSCFQLGTDILQCPAGETRSSLSHVEVPAEQNHFVIEKNLVDCKANEFNFHIKIRFVKNDIKVNAKFEESKETDKFESLVDDVTSRLDDGIDDWRNDQSVESEIFSKRSLKVDESTKSANSVGTNMTEYFEYPCQNIGTYSHCSTSFTSDDRSSLTDDSSLDDHIAPESFHL